MTILFYEDHEVWANGLPAALRGMGHFVYVPRHEEGLRELHQVLRVVQPELIITVGWTQRRTPPYIGAIRAHCAATRTLHVYWSVEDPTHTDVWTLDYLERAAPDAVLTISPSTVGLLRQLGYVSEELPLACNPILHRPGAADPRYATDIALIASCYPPICEMRQHSLRALLAGLRDGPWRVGIWGPDWDQAETRVGLRIPDGWWRGPVSHGEIATVYSSARLVMAPQNEPELVSGHTFEALASGALLLTYRSPGVVRWFDEGSHLLCTASATETVVTVGRYLADEAGAQAIRLRGRAEVLARHTYQARAEQLLTWVSHWLPEKRRLGRLERRHPLRREYVDPCPTEGESAEGRLRLTFPVPRPQQGEHLVRAELECFAERVDQGGDVALLREDGWCVGRRYLAARGLPHYPFQAGWVRWDVTAVVAQASGSTSLTLDVASERGLAATWAHAGWQPANDVLMYRRSSFLPRLAVLWSRAPHAP